MNKLQLNNKEYEIEFINSEHLKGREWLVTNNEGFFKRCDSFEDAFKNAKKDAYKPVIRLEKLLATDGF